VGGARRLTVWKDFSPGSFFFEQRLSIRAPFIRLMGVDTKLTQNNVAKSKENPVPIQKITPFLWFDNQAEEAAKFYVSIFPNSKIVKVMRYSEAGPGPAGSAMTVAFELDRQPFTALNGGPHFKFTEAISFVVHCETQEEVDTYWEKLSADGGEVQCGWLRDKFGLSWQVVPNVLLELLGNPDPKKAARVAKAMFQMKKFDIRTLQKAANEA
jgi:predicted 3-demethylubiquinone-9 3-methyltransferase (glyoxalase superfamily)